MNTLQKFLARLLLPRAQYEAGRRWTSDRSQLPGFVQDARLDAGEMVRAELVRKSRWFEKNDALANRLAEVFVEFTVGAAGPPMTPASGDDEWNQRAGEFLREWLPVADANSRLGYGGLMTTASWRRFFDGEFFILKTKEAQGRPRLQGIAAHRVATPDDLLPQEGKTVVDGVAIDSLGNPTGYWIQDGLEPGTARLRSASEVIHIFEPESPGQYRGLPLLTPVLNDLHDFNDLFLFEMLAAKVQGKDAVWYETQDGGVPRSVFGGIPSTGFSTGESNLTSDAEIAAKRATLQKVFGGRSFAVKQGEKVNYIASNRPSVTSQWFFDYYASRICAGVGISKLLVLPWSIQGTVARSDLDLARNYFLSRFAPFAAACREIYLFAIGTARFSQTAISDAPADWTKVNVRPPRAVNVDIGRNSAATIAELESSLTTYEEQFAMRGLDWREQFRQRGREEKFLDGVAAENGISVDRLRRSLTESLKAQVEIETAQQQQEENA